MFQWKVLIICKTLIVFQEKGAIMLELFLVLWYSGARNDIQTRSGDYCECIVRVVVKSCSVDRTVNTFCSFSFVYCNSVHPEPDEILSLQPFSLRLQCPPPGSHAIQYFVRWWILTGLVFAPLYSAALRPIRWHVLGCNYTPRTVVSGKGTPITCPASPMKDRSVVDQCFVVVDGFGMETFSQSQPSLERTANNSSVDVRQTDCRPLRPGVSRRISVWWFG